MPPPGHLYNITSMLMPIFGILVINKRSGIINLDIQIIIIVTITVPSHTVPTWPLIHS